MRSVILILSISFLFYSAAAQKKITVAKDGSGNYTSVQAALDAVPEGNKQKLVIFVKKGTYKEVITVDARKSFISLIGEDRDKTILTYDNHAGTRFDNGDTA